MREGEKMERGRARSADGLLCQPHPCSCLFASSPDWKRVASERAKRTLWLAAATKLVCPLLPGRLCGVGRDKESC